jgi:hypothetical protein
MRTSENSSSAKLVNKGKEGRSRIENLSPSWFVLLTFRRCHPNRPLAKVVERPFYALS